MLQEFVQEISQLARASQELQEIQPEGPNSRKRLLWNPLAMTTTEFEVPPPKRTLRVLTLASLVDAVRRFGSPQESALWIKSGEVVCGLDSLLEAPLGSKIVYQFGLHPVFESLRTLNVNGLTHQQFVRFLRGDIGDATVKPNDLLNLIKVVKFDTLSSSASENTKDLAKMGREVASMVSGLEGMPESFRLAFNPFPQLSGELNEGDEIDDVGIGFTLQVDLDNSKFLVAPIAGETTSAMNLALEDLRRILKGRLSQLDIFSGSID